MEVYVRLLHKRELIAIRLPKGSPCRSVLERFCNDEDFYIHQNGYHKSLEDELRPGETVDVAGRLSGGKGGFGSMLRAIGAQIEKTTNREACRDLTGRRLRAINDERRFRHYARIKAQREMEREEKRRRKLETLATSEPRHEFDDKEYINERMAIPERVEQALEDAFSEGPGSSSSLCHTGTTSTEQTTQKKLKGWIEEGLNDFESGNIDETETIDENDSNGKSTNGHLRDSPSISNEITTGVVLQSVPLADDSSARQKSSSQQEENKAKTDSFEQATVEVNVDSGDMNESLRRENEIFSRDTESSQKASSPVVENCARAASPSFHRLDLSCISSSNELASKFSADELKAELSRLGVKCGGTPKERAERLWFVKDLKFEDIPKKYRAKK